MDLTGSFFQLINLLMLALLVFKIFCLVDAAIRKEAAYRAADKQTKQTWLVILGIGVAVTLLPLGALGSLLQIAALIAAIVYFVDVRPAVREIGRGRGTGQHMGPYGPW